MHHHRRSHQLQCVVRQKRLSPQRRRGADWLTAQLVNGSNTSVATSPRLRATARFLRSGNAQLQTIARGASANLDGVWQLDCTQGGASFPLVFYGTPNANGDLMSDKRLRRLGLTPVFQDHNPCWRVAASSGVETITLRITGGQL